MIAAIIGGCVGAILTSLIWWSRARDWNGGEMTCDSLKVGGKYSSGEITCKSLKLVSVDDEEHDSGYIWMTPGIIRVNARDEVGRVWIAANEFGARITLDRGSDRRATMEVDKVSERFIVGSELSDQGRATMEVEDGCGKIGVKGVFGGVEIGIDIDDCGMVVTRDDRGFPIGRFKRNRSNE